MIALLVGLAFAEPSRLALELLDIDRPGSAEWDEQVAFRLAVAYDKNRSGALERHELGRVDCDVWQSLDVALVEGSPYPGLQRTYGFEHGQWLGMALGIAEPPRRPAARALRRCGLRPPHGPTAAEQLYVIDLVRALPEPGSPVWEAGVRDAMVTTYDRDASRAVEGGELMQVDCAVFVAIELGLLSQRQTLLRYLETPEVLGIEGVGAFADRLDMCLPR
ncbi:MAG: hypothetical protein EP330_01090 [Deltaproteobacteria bacterium]|nr:MAG: hypothetical protein EP330_01090 [Deltaproteobacteria bacterium]